ncbi:MAG: sensor histidine kinase [Oscillospiraceae bacterium]|jgi:two-component system sensor histidine kinase YesM|nr:sensor histidine kinase [Oscillospiraceae bacterium]
MSRIKSFFDKTFKYYRRKSIQFTISLSFTVVAVVCMLVMGALLYRQFADNMRQTIINDNQQLVSQIVLNINNYTTSMRGISDSIYYNVIKNTDLADRNISKEMSLLYEANKNDLISVACFTEDGGLVDAAPTTTQKENIDVRSQDWFVRAMATIENSHFSIPHVQNIFEDSNQRYRWVISLSRMVELTSGGNTSIGVLLVDMNYNGIETIFREMGANSSGYVYLIDRTGQIIYHPKQDLIYSGIYKENNISAVGYSDGIYQENFDGAARSVIVKQTGYTGWRVISVVPTSEFTMSVAQTRILVIAVTGFAIMLIIIMNAFISSRVADPIKKLEQSVRDLEKGNLALNIFIGGPYEIERLGKAIRSTVDRIISLMGDIVKEHEQKRRMEFDALQAQINPHFLYNTLDSIVWMIESERYPEAITMVTALASLFRISLSKGKNIISIGEELKHAQNYLHIQKIRYKNKFSVEINADSEILSCGTIKLIVQPLIENSIYHAMQIMDGDGEIKINGYQKNGGVYIEVRDNGMGMTQEKIASLLEDTSEPAPVDERSGSGIGLKNVHQRIKLYYGQEYGLEIESELDEGTTVRIHLPYARFDEDA